VLTSNAISQNGDVARKTMMNLQNKMMKHYSKADIRQAMWLLLLMPEYPEDFTQDDIAFLRSDLVCRISEYPDAMAFVAFWRKKMENP
jgi:hypothetical protein